ncbi:hypothetical protein CMI37_34155 [Candidatus Pacearchaeota archaeon]|nr:hypothetical protein [Candidatus Pacearchaeota archaeon]|tara:strand:- start:465 stop:1154 length:690 start_codon:yes stop_codon:yes gene_type:complete
MPKEKEKSENEKQPKGLEALAEMLTGISTSVNALTQRMDGLERTQQPAQKPADKEIVKREEKTEEELDDMSRSEFMQHLVGEIGETVIKPLAARIDQSAQDTKVDKTASAIEKARAEHKDFGEFEKEIIAVAQEVPGISVERAYQTARQENPEKAVEMDEKYKSDEDKTAEADKEALAKANEEGMPFGGLTPTSGVVSKDVAYEDDREAFDAAWDENVTQAGLEGMFRN